MDCACQASLSLVLLSYLFYTYYIFVNPNLPIHPLSPSSYDIHKFILYICVSVSALHIRLSTPFFFLDSTYMERKVSIWYLFFSFWLTSFCMTVSRGIHVSLQMAWFHSFLWLIVHCYIWVLGKFRSTYMLSCFSHVWLFATLWISACQVPLSMGFSRQE